jgi:hypothetical protein
MGGRAVEGAPLLREYGSKAHRGFESHPIRQPLRIIFAIGSRTTGGLDRKGEVVFVMAAASAVFGAADDAQPQDVREQDTGGSMTPNPSRHRR